MLTDKIYIDMILKTKTVLRIYLYLQVIKLEATECLIEHCTVRSIVYHYLTVWYLNGIMRDLKFNLSYFIANKWLCN